MQAMTPHEINLAIGKSLGFEQCPTAMCQGFPPELCYRKDTYIGELPDFYGSLDRMHEVERSLSTTGCISHELGTFTSQAALYACHVVCIQAKILLEDYQWPAFGYDAWMVFDFIHATSQQRAEAYLRTLNLWTNTNAPSRQDATVNSQPLSM